VKFEVFKKDLGFLTKAVKNSQGELDFQIRPGNKINIYYKGNSLADLSFRNGLYKVKVHKKFELKKALKKDKFKRFSDYEFGEEGQFYDTARVEPKLIYAFLQKEVLKALMSSIKCVNNGEEIGFEQSLMTDNFYRSEYIIIDRQVGGGGMPGMLDLLALKQVNPGKYQFEAVEVKLGNNVELRKDVFGQIDRYVKAIVNNLESFKSCYERNYAQKKALGLFPSDWADSIEITDKVEGKIIVGSYYGIGVEYIKDLYKNFPDMPYAVKQLRNMIPLD
jgi:hypothetical protein